jgi:hypothetical protein
MRVFGCVLLESIADVPYWAWALSLVGLAIGCDGAPAPSGGGSLSGLSGSVPGLVTALITLAQAYRIKAKAKADSEATDLRVQSALAQAYEDKSADLAASRAIAEEALATSRKAQAAAEECERREQGARAEAAQRELDWRRTLDEIRAETRASIAPRST